MVPLHRQRVSINTISLGFCVLAFQVSGYGGELRERRLKIFDDFGNDDFEARLLAKHVEG